MAKEQTPKMTTAEFRLAFPSLLEPREYNGKVNYEMTMLFPKAEKDAVLAIKQFAIAAAKRKWPNIDNDGLKKLKWPWSDGDEKDYDGFAGNTCVRAKRSTAIGAPAIVDSKVQPIIDANKVYGGAWAMASLDAYAWENSGSKGVSLGIDAVQIVRDDEPFGDGNGLKRAQSIFTPVATGSEDEENYEKVDVDVEELNDL